MATRPDPPIITLTTDFGDLDSYVGVMKGVILSIAPAAQVVDIVHSVPPQDIQAAAYHISVATPHFPAGSIHVIVVDPGVGTERRALIVETERATFIAPDNGVLTWILESEPPLRMIQLDNPAYQLDEVSKTFHGRDIFAPAAAHIARGVELADLGAPASDPVRIPVYLLTRGLDGSVNGQVQHIDRFGNAITNIARDAIGPDSPHTPPPGVTAGGRDLGPVRRTYADAAPGQPLALLGSAGFLEIAVRDGDAAALLNLSRGDHVTVRGSR